MNTVIIRYCDSFSIQQLVLKYCKWFEYCDKTLLVRLLPFPTVSQYLIITVMQLMSLAEEVVWTLEEPPCGGRQTDESEAIE